MLTREQEREALAEVDAAVQYVHVGLQSLLDMLGGSPPDKVVRAAGLYALLQPMADQASQAAPMSRRLLDSHDSGQMQ